MAPKATPGKNELVQKPPSPKSAPTRRVKGGTGKKAKEKQKKPKLNLKGWLETKADWAKFDAWAEINSKPRKTPEPEPVVRASKPLSQMKKRLVVLSKPHKLPNISKTCRTDFRVSKKALTAAPSKRIIKLATVVMKNIDPDRELPTKISHSALCYKASKRIIEISQPQMLFLSEFCKILVKRQNVTTSEETNDRAKKSALAKKAVQCPDLMTDEEMKILVSPTGVFKSALNYKITPWMTYLALPSYRFLKDQTDEKAEEWKKIIVEDSETRGKEALKYKKKKRQEEEKMRKPEKDDKNVDEIKEEDVKNVGEEQPIVVEAQEDGGNVIQKEDVTPDVEVSEEQANDTIESEGETGNTEQYLTIDEKEQDKELSEVAPKAEASDPKPQEEATEAKEVAKRRKAERNAWRFEPSPCADNPFEIKKSALKGKVSPRMNELSKHRERQDRSCKMKPFEVRKSALDGPISEKMAELARPSHPLDPVERPPPREKDPFGRPIFPMPSYGKKIPGVKPYQQKCPEKEEDMDHEGEKKKNEGRKRKAIDPIVFEPTIDPCINPDRAKRQLKARKAAKEEIRKSTKADETSDKIKNKNVTSAKEEDNADVKDNEPHTDD